MDGVTDLFTGAGTRVAGAVGLAALFAAVNGARLAGSATTGGAAGLTAGLADSAED